MKSEPRSLPRSGQTRRRRTRMGQSPLAPLAVRTDNADVSLFSAPSFSAPSSQGVGAAGKCASVAIDLNNLLHFSQQLYAHALTLQEMIRSEGKVTYEVLKPGYDLQAARQFEVFYHSAKLSPASRKRDAKLYE